MQALNHADLAEAALSPKRPGSNRKLRKSDDSLFSIGSSNLSGAAVGVNVPQLNMDAVGVGSGVEDGYVSPPSMSPIKSGREKDLSVIGKIKQQVKVMKQHRQRQGGNSRYVPETFEHPVGATT